MNEELNLIDLWEVTVKWRKTIFWTVATLTFLSIVVSLVLPEKYRATADIIPVGSQGAAGMGTPLGQFGLGGLLGTFLPDSGSPQIIAILNSRSLSERIIQKFDLMKVLFADSWDETTQTWKVSWFRKQPTLGLTVEKLFDRLSVVENKKTKVVTISVEMPDKKLAADVANGFIEGLSVFIKENAFTAAKRHRIFVEGQLEKNRAKLLTSGRELTQFYSVNKISNVSPTLDVDVSIGADNRAISKIPDKKIAEEKIAELQDQAAEVKKKLEEISSNKQREIVTNIPQQVYLQYLSFHNELLRQINGLLTQQYEMAKIDESKEDLNFQIIDRARIPERRSSPKRTLIVGAAFTMSLLFALLAAFTREYFHNARNQRRGGKKGETRGWEKLDGQSESVPFSASR